MIWSSVVSETLYVALVLGSSAVALPVATWLWRTNDRLAARLFVVLILLHAVTGVFVVAELLAPSRTLSIQLFGVHSAVAAAVPPVWFLFTVTYVGYRRRLTRPVLALVGGWYVVVAALELTNPFHRFVWGEYTVEATPFPYVVGEPTGAAMLLTFPQPLFYYAGLGVLGSHLLFGSTARRTGAAVLFVGFLPPLVVTSAWFVGALPGPLNGAFVIGSTWTLAVAAWAAFRHGLFDVVPLARETVFESLDTAVLVVDRTGHLLDYNRTAVETFPDLADAEGEPVETALPVLVRDAPANPSAPATEAAPDRADAESSGEPTPDAVVDEGDDGTDRGEPGYVDGFTYVRGGEPREYSVSVTPLRADGTVEGYALLVRDVTDRQRHVRMLERQTAQLERFASTLSHDLKNPLNVALGRIELVRGGADEAHLAKASEALDRMDEIIDDTLALAREGQAIDELQRVELADVAERAWETTDTGDATLAVDPDADVEVYADPSRLRTVFENCFRNAVEHGTGDADDAATLREADGPGDGDDGSQDGDGTGDGESAASGPAAGDESTRDTETPLVRGGSAPEFDDGDRGSNLTVTLGRHGEGFYVEDDGPGVPPDQREEVFEYEFSTTSRGTGLGLAIVDAIARAHGWSVEMTEGGDGGARVVFSGVEVVESGSDATD